MKKFQIFLFQKSTWQASFKQNSNVAYFKKIVIIKRTILLLMINKLLRTMILVYASSTFFVLVNN